MSNQPQHRKQKFIGRLLWLVYRVYSATFRYRLHAEDPDWLCSALADLDDPAPKPGENFIYAFWHQDELALLPYFRNRDIVAMVSDSRDGTIMATALECFGYLTTRGSSTRGGVKGFIASIRLIRKGYKFTMAVDGPRGPIYRTKEGIIRLSQKSGRPIFPFRAWPERFHLFRKAWNQAKLPLPFSRIHILVGRPAMYSREELDEALNRLIRDRSE